MIDAIRKVFHLQSNMLVIGSRGSQLALWQAHWVQRGWLTLGTRAASKSSRPQATRSPDVPLAKVGTKGLFTKEIEEALLDGRVDLAVHSLKDLPTEVAGRARRSRRFRSAKIRAMPWWAPAGRSAEGREGRHEFAAPRRATARMRPDLKVESVRGNVDTRVRKLDEGQYDAIVLAAAGLTRLGWADRIAETLVAGDDVSGRGTGSAGGGDTRRRELPASRSTTPKLGPR